MDGVHAVLHAVSVKVEQLAVAALVVSVGCARAPAPAAQTVAAPAAPAGDAPSEVAPAIDRFDVEMADARVVRGRLIATESACDKYCWARVQVEEVVSAQEGDALGEIRVAFRSGGPGDAFHVTPLLRHRMIAIEDTDVFEVSTTELDDVVRLEDAYGREGTSAP